MVEFTSECIYFVQGETFAVTSHVVDREVTTSNMNSGGVAIVMGQVSTMCPRTLLMGPIVISVSLSKLMGS